MLRQITDKSESKVTMTSCGEESGLESPCRRMTLPMELLTITREISQQRFVAVSVPELGHLRPVFNIAKQLTQRGHQVTLITCNFLVPKLESLCEGSNITLVGIAKSVRAPEDQESEAFKLKRSKRTLNLYMYYSRSMHKGLKKAVRNIQPTAIIADFQTLCGCWVGKELGIPVAVNFSDTVFMDVAGASPSPWHPYLMLFRAPFVLKKWSYFLNSAVFHISSMVCESLYTRVMFVNSFWGLHEAALMPPNVYFTGPMEDRSTLICTQTSDDAFNDWLEKMRALHLPVVYVTFGTMVELSEKQIRSIFFGLAAIKEIAVAWSLRQAQQALLPVKHDQVPHTFYIHHWFPQQEVMSLEDVAVVISHCGFGGLTQLISNGKPVVAVPFSGDQPFNAAAASRQGIGEVLNKDKLTPELVEAAVRKVLAGPQFKENAMKMRTALHTSGGSWECALHAEHLASHGCEFITRTPPSLGEYTLRAAGRIAFAVGAIWLLQYLRGSHTSSHR